jgi:indole-3-acetate monooxygenase
MDTRPFPLPDAFSLAERAAPIPAAGQATPNDDLILHAALALTEQIRGAGDEIEAGRRLPREIAAAMQKAGVFGMAMPRAWGGAELDPLTQFRVIEALAMADG